MYYKVTAFKKSVVIDSPNPYGFITVYFGPDGGYLETGRISLTKFYALSHILENDYVGYDPKTKEYITLDEYAKFSTVSKGPVV